MLRFSRLGTTTLYSSSSSTGEPPEGNHGELYFILPKSIPVPARTMTLDQTWEFQHSTLGAGYYLFLEAGQTLQTDNQSAVTAFANRIHTLLPRVVRGQHSSLGWVTGNPNTPASVGLQTLDFVRINSRSGYTVVTKSIPQTLQFQQLELTINPGTPFARAAGESGFNLTNPGAGSSLSDDDDNPRTSGSRTPQQRTPRPPSGGSGAQVYITGAAAQPIEKVGETLFVPLSGGGRGSLQFGLQQLVQSDIDPGYLDMGIYYVIPEPTLGRDQSMRYPMLDLVTPGGSLGARSAIDLQVTLFPADHLDSRFSFANPAAHTVRTYFRTDNGEHVFVSPVADAGFAFTHVPNPGVFPARGANVLTFFGLTPIGNYELQLEEQPADVAHLMGGQSGTEYFSFKPRNGSTSGDVLAFFHEQRGYAPEFGSETPPPNEPNIDLLQLTYLTSWATVGLYPGITQNGHIPQYFAQPDDAVLHGPGAEFLNDYLEYVEVPTADLPTPAPDTTFPIVPVAGVIAPEDRVSPPIDADDFVSFEKTVINPTRKERITGIKETAFASSSGRRLLQTGTRNTTTPQGMLVTVENTDWQQLTMAKDEDSVYLRFSDISPQFQDALSSNRLFMVATQESELMEAGSTFSDMVKVVGWPFQFEIGQPPNGLEPPEDGPHRFNNVLIFKFADKTFDELAADTRLWANAPVFTGDPPAVQTWLQDFIADIRDKVANASDDKTKALYQPLLTILDNPNWNGILGFNVTVPPSSMPCEVQGLLGGIRHMNEFKAHHVGFEIAKVKSDASDIDKSSIFGLIDYNDLEGSTLDVDYEFIVRKLQVRFANSEIATFDSDIRIIMNRVIDEQVLAGSFNYLDLKGSYQLADGHPKYTFATPREMAPKTLTVTGSGITLPESVTFTKATLVAGDCAMGGNSTVTSAFQFNGSIKFRNAFSFDFFSFDKMVFSNMKLNMSFDFEPPIGSEHSLPKKPTLYKFSPGDTRIDVSLSRPRQNSLLSNFPLRLNGFHYNEAGIDVTKMGYFEIPSLVPGWSGAEKPLYGISFTIDLGPLSSLMKKGGPKGAIKILAAWEPDGGDVTFGVTLGAGSNGKRELGIDGVFLVSLSHFGFQKIYADLDGDGDDDYIYAFFLSNAFLKILGTQLPPGGNFSLVLYVPFNGQSDRVNLENLGWFLSYQSGEGAGAGGPAGAVEMSIVFTSATKVTRGATVTFQVSVKNKFGLPLKATVRTEIVSFDGRSYGTATGRPLPPAPQTLTKQIIAEGTGTFDFNWRATQSGRYKVVAYASTAGADQPESGKAESGIIDVDQATNDPNQAKQKKTSILSVDYLGIGNRVQVPLTAAELRALNSVEKVISALKTKMTISETGAALTRQLTQIYNPNAGLIIGFDLTIFEFVRLAVVFLQENQVYGALLGFSTKAPAFIKGFQFQVLYRQITDDIGVFSIILKLPDYLRQWNIGTGTLTLPIIGLDIYTNGNFKIDFGFPYNFDFSRALCFQIIIMVGPVPVPLIASLGLYFSYLTGATSALVPKLGPNPNADADHQPMFDPVFEAGFGFRFGLGREINKGVLKAGATISLVAMLEGALAWYWPNGRTENAGTPDFTKFPDWFRVSGQAGLIGRIYGQVDFGIIKASVNVELRAIFSFVFETYADIRFGITLSVEVEASITIAFVEISFSFSASFSFEFSIPNPMGAPPWAEFLQAGGSTSAQTVRRLQQAATPLVWNPAAQVFSTAQGPLELVFTTALTSGTDDGGGAQAHAVPLLAIERGDGSGDANSLVEAFTRWTLFTHLGLTAADDNATLTRQDLEDLNARLNPTPAPTGVPQAPERLIDYATLRSFLETTFGTINIGGTPASAMQATLFPVVPEMTVKVTTDPEGADGPDEIVNRDLKTFNSYGQTYHDALAAYFGLLAVDVQNKSDLATTRNLLQDPPAARSMAETVFEDYFAMLVKGGFNQALEWARANLVLGDDASTTTVGALMGALGQGPSGWTDSGFDTAAKMSARYFLHGLRMPPNFDGEVDPVVRSEGALPLYELTGQQVEVNLPSTGTWTLELVPNGSTSGWISASSALTYTPDATANDRIAAFSSDTTAAGIYDDVSVEGVDPLRSQPAMFAFKPRASYERPRDTDGGFIYPIADSLLNRLEELAASTPTLTPFNEGQEATDLSSTTWNWALQIPFTAQQVRRTITVTNSDGSVASNDEPIPNTYEIGGTDEQTRDIIGAFVQYGANSSVASVDLYYLLDGVDGTIFGQTQTATASAGLTKTNLSTVSAPQDVSLQALLPADDYSAQLAPEQAVEFLSLLWEASIVNSPGYYLYYDNGAADAAESGLPEEAFAGTENRVKLTLVVRFNGTTAGINALDIRNPNFVEGDFHAQLDGELNWLPTLVPGAVAFELSRPKGATSTTDASADLMNLFSLLSYWVSGAGGFSESIHGLPVGPTKGENDDDLVWSYRQGIKVFPYVNGGSTYRYAAVGKTVTLGFEFLDVFGNALPDGVTGNPSTDIAVLYSDPLMAVGNWPGVRLSYTMAGGNLDVTLSFASEGYDPDPNDTDVTPVEAQTLADAREAALEGYRNIREQLVDPNISVFLTTTVAPDLHSDHTSAVRTFVDQVIDYFDINGAAPADLNLTAGISQEQRNAQTDNIFAVQVGLTVERPQGMVSVEVQENLPDAWHVTTAVPPEATAGIQAPITEPVFDPSAPGYDMWQPDAHEAFALEFEAAFPEFKVATGLGADGPHTIWAIRMGTGAGISYTIENSPSFFAPAPLSRVLQSREGVPLRLGGLASGETPESFAEIDMDVWGRAFLEAVDRFLSPEMAVSARQVAYDPYRQIIAAKQSIADAIAGGVTWVVAPEPSDAELGAAQESYRQKLLTKLSSAYDVETAVVYPVTTTNGNVPSGQSPPRIFGHVSGTPVDPTSNPEDPRAGYSYSNAKVDLSGDIEQLAFLFSSGRTESQAAANVNVSYAISHIEHDIRDADREGYQASSWLTLVLPEEPAVLGEVDIPIALREYPLPPELISHQAVAVYPDSATTLAQTKAWEYHYTINQTARPQDTTFSRITFNVPLNGTLRSLQAGELDLFDWLARFWREYPRLQPDLDLLAKGVRGFETGDREKAATAVTWFADIVAGVGNTWAAWVTAQATLSRRLEQALAEYEWIYTMNERLDFATSEAQIQLFASSDTPTIPAQIPDIEVSLEDNSLSRLEPTVSGDSGSYAYPWSGDDLPEMRQRTLFIENLDVLNTENAWGALHLERNLHLTSVGDQSRMTNERFVYQTPETRFVNKVTPLLDTIKPINIAADGATKSLKQHLTDTLNALFSGDGWSGQQRLLKVGVRYIYDVRGQSGPAEGPDQADEFQAYLPVTQLTPFELQIDATAVSTFADGLIATMNTWLADIDPAREKAFWEFDLSIFAALTATDLPVLRLRRLWLGLDKING